MWKEADKYWYVGLAFDSFEREVFMALEEALDACPSETHSLLKLTKD